MEPQAASHTSSPKLDYRPFDDIRDGTTDPVAHGFAWHEDEVAAVTLDWLAGNSLEPRR